MSDPSRQQGHPVVRADALVKEYRRRDGSPVKAIDRVSFDV